MFALLILSILSKICTLYMSSNLCTSSFKKKEGISSDSKCQLPKIQTTSFCKLRSDFRVGFGALL